VIAVPSDAGASTVLVVDDDEGILILMAEALRAEGYEVATALSAKEARAWLKERRPDLLLLDLKLKDSEGPALIAALHSDNTLPPFVVVTGQGDERVAVEVMKQGALDYVMKDTALIELLPSVVERALTGITQGKALAAAQEEQARLEREVLAVGERERHSIGADLHDGLGQQLTAIELMCAGLKADAARHPQLAQGLDTVGKMLREAIAQTRFLSRGLVPLGSDAEALQIGLAELAQRINALRTARCEFICPQPVTVEDAFVASHLYRIAQEAANNAIKHARAKSITIRLDKIGEDLRVEVKDDGAGLTKKSGGLGLGVMQHRAKLIGGQLQVTSKKGNGVTVSCRVRIKK
jgi:signal transduction histidine kinase